MEHTALFEISRCLYAIIEFNPLTLKDIDLEIVINVVDEEAHMLSQLQSQSEHRFLVQMLHTSDFACPDVLQFKLDSFNWKQKSEQSVIFLCDIWAEHKMDGPLAIVVQ